MSTSKWREIIIALLIGIVIGVITISFGLNFIAQHIEVAIVETIFILIVLGLLIIIIYKKRRTIVANSIGIDVNEQENISDLFQNIWHSAEKKDTNKLKESIKVLITIIISKYAEFIFRVWVFRTFFAIIVAFGGIIGSSLILKQNELIEEQKNLLNNQNSLINEEVRYLIDVDKPNIGLKNSSAGIIKIGKEIEYESYLKIENYGSRKAVNFEIDTRIIEVYAEDCREIYKEKIKITNPVFPGQIMDYIQNFTVSNPASSVYLCLDLKYQDDLNKKTDAFKLFYKYPNAKQLQNKKEFGLLSIDENEFNQIKNYLMYY